MRRGRMAGVLLGALMLVAPACGDDDDEAGDRAGDGDAAADDGGRATGADVYEGELEDGSSLVVRLDVPADDPAVAPFDELRALTGVPEPTWLVAEIAVPDGVDGTGRFVTFVEDGVDPLDDDPLDQEDGVVNSGFACAELDDWYGQVASPDAAVDEAYQELYEGPCGSQTLQVLAPGGTTTTYVLVVDGPLPPFATIRAGLVNELEPA